MSDGLWPARPMWNPADGGPPKIPPGPSPREWLLWVRAWTRGLGHSWIRNGQRVACRACGMPAGMDVGRNLRSAGHGASPHRLRDRLLLELSTLWLGSSGGILFKTVESCGEVQVRQVMEA